MIAGSIGLADTLSTAFVDIFEWIMRCTFEICTYASEATGGRRQVEAVIFSQPETLVRDTCPLADASGYDRNDTTHCIEKNTA